MCVFQPAVTAIFFGGSNDELSLNYCIFLIFNNPGGYINDSLGKKINIINAHQMIHTFLATFLASIDPFVASFDPFLARSKMRPNR